MAVMATQLTDELVEGVEALAQGDRNEGFVYLMDVAQNIAQLASLAAVGPEGAEPIAPLKRSPIIDSMKQVTLANGETRLLETRSKTLRAPDIAGRSEAQ